jgi:hypothetical protein
VVRPDSLLVVAWSIAVTRRRRTSAVCLAVLIVASVFVFQRCYYGDWLPNTYHLKATAGAGTIARGLDYLMEYASTWPVVGWPLLAAPVVYAAWRRRLLATAALPMLWTLYVVWIGGDAFPAGRFFAPLVPVLALFAGLVLEDLCREARWPALVVASMCLYLHAGGGLWLLHLGPPNWITASYRESVVLAKLGRERVPRSATIGVYYAGTIPYYMPEHRFHDFLGKSDRVIARSPVRPGPPGHNKWDYDYSLGIVRPDVIVTSGPFDRPDEHYRRERDQDYGFHPALWLDPRFQRLSAGAC